MIELEPTTIVATAREQVSAQLEGEAAILGLRNGVYYGLDRVGTRVWTLLETPMAISSLCERLLQDFEADPAALEADVLALLRQLQAEGLLRVVVPEDEG